MPITLENVEAAFTYHPWNEEQTQKGKPIRAAAKAAAKALLEFHQSACDLRNAINASAPLPSNAPKSDLAHAADDRRITSLDLVEQLIEQEEKTQQIIAGLGQIVMIANAAITFEAAQLQPTEPAKADSEQVNVSQTVTVDTDGSLVVKATIPADVSAEDAVKILDPVVSHLTEGDDKDARPQVTD